MNELDLAFDLTYGDVALPVLPQAVALLAVAY
jgi:hypothetical protein